jgi:hypothetical protein
MPVTPSTPHSHPIVLRLGALAMAGIVCLVAGELAVRAYLALPPPEDATHVPDADAGFRIRPGYGDLPEDHPDHVNALGFRDREHAIAKPPGTLRIIGIGDSFVYGMVPPEQNFLRVAARRLDTRVVDSLDVEMVMMGLGGYGPENVAGLVRSLALRMDPDLLVVCFFVGNDVTGIPVRAEVLRGRRYFTGSTSRWRTLARRSRLFLLAEHAAVQLVSTVRSGERGGDERPPSGTAAPDRSPRRLSVEYVEVQAVRLPVYMPGEREKTEPLWRTAEHWLRDIDDRCDGAGVPWALLAIPSEIQVDPAVRASVLERLGISRDALDPDAPQRRLRALARDLGVPFVDPLDRMRAATDAGGRLYVPDDTHWNARGNALAGEILAEVLEDLIGPARTSR